MLKHLPLKKKSTTYTQTIAWLHNIPLMVKKNGFNVKLNLVAGHLLEKVQLCLFSMPAVLFLKADL